MDQNMRLQTDQEEFLLNKVKILNLKYRVEMFTTQIRCSKAFAAEKKLEN